LATRERHEPPRLLFRGAVRVEQLAVADVRRLCVEQVVADRSLAKQRRDVREFSKRKAAAAKFGRKVRRPQPAPLDLLAELVQPRLDFAVGEREKRALQRKSTFVDERADGGEQIAHWNRLV